MRPVFVAGVPESTPVVALKLTPLTEWGEIEVRLRVGGGPPLAVTANEDAAPTVNAALFALVNAGAVALTTVRVKV
jgi:hypothetical protein